jgi:hypothetical protein
MQQPGHRDTLCSITAVRNQDVWFPTEKEGNVSKIVPSVVLFGVLGLVAGYLIFGRVAGSYVPLQSLIMPAEGGLARFGQALRGIPEIRRNILVTGAAGAVVGAIYATVVRR